MVDQCSRSAGNFGVKGAGITVQETATDVETVQHARNDVEDFDDTQKNQDDRSVVVEGGISKEGHLFHAAHYILE